MVSDEIRKAREMFMAIAIVEHHISPLSKFSTYDLCEIFAESWKAVEAQAGLNAITFEMDSVIKINVDLAGALGLSGSKFLKQGKWKTLIDECGDSIEEDPEHIISWIFSSLYWDHLTQLNLATSWLYSNALRIQQGLSICRLSIENVGVFLDGLSGSGPPIYDGQAFFLHSYS
jgi:hypothetical protein